MNGNAPPRGRSDGYNCTSRNHLARTMNPHTAIRLRPLEREDLTFVHQLDNNANVMRYWFEEPYETFTELTHLYD